MSLVKLPYELVCYVVEHLSLADVSNLSFSCRRFQFLLHEPNAAKLVLETKAPYSAEARNARVTKRYGAGLRRLIKRRDAVASVSPYLAAIVAYAETWIYENGVLCYARGSQLRILDLHHSATRESVVDICSLVDKAIEEPCRKPRFRFQLLYYANDIISCMYSHAKQGHVSGNSWLVVLNPHTGQLITVHRLESTSQIFVRNTDRFLYYGTNSEMGRDGYNRWVIRGFDLTARTWMERRLDFPAVIGSDLGSTVCFDIFDGYFYGLSNQTCLEVEEVDWVSYYTCFRFPLSPHGFRDVEQPPRQQFWRRNHTEGPIDDRWTFLRMFQDETTGQLKVVESRKEWLSGRISPRRTYYTTVINFDKAASKPADPDPSVFEPEKPQPGPSMESCSRDPHMVHPSHDSSTFAFTLSKCPVRSYYPSSQTSIDLVDDSESFDVSHQRIRIRGGSRRLWTPCELEQRKGLPMEQRPGDQSTLGKRIDDLYHNGMDVFWPPDRDPSAPAPALADLYAVLNPPGYLGKPSGSWDERSLIYATGGMGGGPKALVFVSWDPAIHLAGTAPYPRNTFLSTTPSPADGSLGAPCVPSPENTAKSSKKHPALKPNAAVCPDAPSEKAKGANVSPMAVLESAMYLDISRGYHFAR